MLRKSLTFALLMTLLCTGAWAGDKHAHMEEAMAQMANCGVCKNMMPHMAELGPVMKSEVVTLNNGMAIIHNVTDKGKVAKYHKVSEAMSAAGEKCMMMTDKEAKDGLCGMCQGIRDVAKAGAHVSTGLTKTGDVFVMSSEDPAIQKRITKVQKQFEMMLAMHHE